MCLPLATLRCILSEEKGKSEKVVKAKWDRLATDGRVPVQDPEVRDVLVDGAEYLEAHANWKMMAALKARTDVACWMRLV